MIEIRWSDEKECDSFEYKLKKDSFEYKLEKANFYTRACYSISAKKATRKISSTSLQK